jgi:hypothetical protein
MQCHPHQVSVIIWGRVLTLEIEKHQKEFKFLKSVGYQELTVYFDTGYLLFYEGVFRGSYETFYFTLGR